jgi:DNA segregation ATPase FtsK/SpoIIIE, S-DNA-T family
LEVPLTFRDARSVRRDVLVSCEPSTRLGEIVAALVGEDRAAPGAPLFVDGREVAASASVIDAGMLAGSVLSVGHGNADDERRRPPGRLALAVVGGMSAGALLDLTEGSFTVGRMQGCSLVLDDDEVSRLHAAVNVAPAEVTIEDLDSANGTLINRVAAPSGSQPLRPGDVVEIGGAVLALTSAPGGEPAELDPTPDGRLRFNKPPRRRRTVAPARFAIPPDPQEPTSRHFALVAVLLPAVLGLGVAFISRNPEYLLFSLGSPLMLGANAWSDRRRGARGYAKHLADRDSTLAALSAQLAVASREQEETFRLQSPDPSTVAAIATLPGARLWERRRDDTDFLVIRVGLVDRPADVILDGNAERAAGLHPVLRSVPATVSIVECGVVGVAGPREASLRLVRSIVVQLAALHSPTELWIALLTAGATEEWEWVKWLPQSSWGDGPAVRHVACTARQRQARLEELETLVQERTADQSRRFTRDRDTAPWPSVVVVLDEVTALRRDVSVVRLLRSGPAVGVFCVCLANDQGGLPAETAATLDVAVEHEGPPRLAVTQGDTVQRDVRPDGLTLPETTRVARSLAPLFEVHVTSASDARLLPEPPVDHLAVLGLPAPTPSVVLDRWRARLPAGRLPAVVGVGLDGPLDLDLSANGPHALVAGMTRSGKSALLQTLVASIALASSPERVTFLLVDFKGGGAFRACEALPHVVGVINNLDGRLVERALDSLQAELTWRQRQFSRVGAQDFEQYRALASRGGAPMPRLVVVVDELAELVEAYRDAILRLNQTARLGGGLGVHLVLATQKPGSVPGLADMRANTSLRLCLRVQDEADSRDVIGVPDAASIQRSLPGRGIVRAGSDEPAPFQAGYLGGRPPASQEVARLEVTSFDLRDLGDTVERTDSPVPADAGDMDHTELGVLVDAIREAAAALPLAEPHRPWLPPLPAVLSADDPRLAGSTRGVAVAVGLIDVPSEQRQDPLILDFDRFGHLLVLGPPRSGRTTMLRTLAGVVADRLRVADVHIYVLDFRRRGLGDLEDLPHCGAVLGIDDPDRLERCFTFLESEIERRSRSMGGADSLAEQRRSGQGGPALPHLLVLCDNYEAFADRFAYEDGGRLVDRFHALMSDGPARGLHFVVTADRRASIGKLGAAVEARLVLRPVDRDDQVAFGIPVGRVPTDMPPGRGFWHEGRAETQICLLTPQPTGEAQVAAIADLARRLRVDDDRRSGPVHIPPLPVEVALVEAEQSQPDPAVRRRGRGVVVGVGGVDGRGLSFDQDDLGAGLVVAGPRGSGRSTTLLTLATGLRAGPDPLPLTIVATRRSPLREIAGQPGTTVLTSAETLAGDLVEAMASPRPGALIIDDAELLLDTPASARLDRIVRNAPDEGWIIVIAGSTTELSRRFAGWIYDVRQGRTGVILQPSSPTDGEVLDLRLPRSAAQARQLPPGRGVLAMRGEWTTVQVAHP